ncbi:MAG: hypothetical protein HQ546_07405 [Planctomycetes bacterium]|nr:hypothetical protein [Planctomycetota bacterium]
MPKIGGIDDSIAVILKTLDEVRTSAGQEARHQSEPPLAEAAQDAMKEQPCTHGAPDIPSIVGKMFNPFRLTRPTRWRNTCVPPILTAPSRLPGKTGKMLHEDMIEARAAAGISAADFLLPRDSAGLVLDFHSFRHGYVTKICKANASPRVMMALARHSDPRLTMKRYSCIGTIDTAKALDTLPRLTGGMKEDSEAVELQATGTDDAPGRPRESDLASDRPWPSGFSEAS